jgi:hypothetical protein
MIFSTHLVVWGAVILDKALWASSVQGVGECRAVAPEHQLKQRVLLSTPGIGGQLLPRGTVLKQFHYWARFFDSSAHLKTAPAV